MSKYEDLEKDDLVSRIEDLETMLDETKRTLEEQNAMLDVLETTDDLTKLLNQRTIYTHLEEELNRAKRYETALSILLLDIDNFKRTIDLEGDLRGNEILKKVGAVIKTQIRKVDIAGRYDGAGALIIFPSTSAKEAKIISERLREQIEELTFEDGLKITISGGLKEYEGEDVIDFLATTNEMMEKAKVTGRNKIELSVTE